MFAGTLIKGSLEDAAGRFMGGPRKSPGALRDLRQRAAESLRWLRRAGKNDWTRRPGCPIPPPGIRSEFICSLDWCGSILDRDPRQLAFYGLPSVPGAGLAFWREMRDARSNREPRTPKPQFEKICRKCGGTFVTRNPARKLCGNECPGKRQKRTVICAQCSGPFARAGNRAKFCGKECFAASRLKYSSSSVPQQHMSAFDGFRDTQPSPEDQVPASRPMVRELTVGQPREGKPELGVTPGSRPTSRDPNCLRCS